eukprot:3459080-Pyramimonas_sp.AAC.1
MGEGILQCSSVWAGGGSHVLEGCSSVLGPAVSLVSAFLGAWEARAATAGFAPEFWPERIPGEVPGAAAG